MSYYYSVPINNNNNNNIKGRAVDFEQLSKKYAPPLMKTSPIASTLFYPKSNDGDNINYYEDLDNLSLPPPPLNLSAYNSPSLGRNRDKFFFKASKENLTNNFPLPPPESELLFPSKLLPSSTSLNNNGNSNISKDAYKSLTENFSGLTVIQQKQDETIETNQPYYSNVEDLVNSNNRSSSTITATSQSDVQNIYDTIFEPVLSTSAHSLSSKSNRAELSTNNYNNNNNFGTNRFSHNNNCNKQSVIYANIPNQIHINKNSHSLPNIKSYLRFNRSLANSSKQEEEVDHLTDLLVKSMENSTEPDFFGMCNKCGEKVLGEGSGCTAMEMVYHIQCFTCHGCNTELRGKPFYAMDNNPHCEECYLNTLEKCSVCDKPILDRILRATGKPYHPNCFTCIVCHKCLDGIPFTVDATNQIHCIDCFHGKFAPRCSVCTNPIVPEPGKTETVRVVALDKSFHVSCYKCEDCDLLLSSEVEGRGCYPLDDHILCRGCNAKRVQAITAN